MALARSGSWDIAIPVLCGFKETAMADRDRVEGSTKIIGGRMKEAAGKATGDEKLKAEGRAEQVSGKVQNTVGAVKTAFRNKD